MLTSIAAWLNVPTGAFQIDQRTIKFLVGAIATTLGLFTYLNAPSITSISASFYVYKNGGEPWSTTIFIGFLFAITALMLGYNGERRIEAILCRVAAVAAACVALFPCKCEDECTGLARAVEWHTEIAPGVHGAAALVMFLILAWFCYNFFWRAWHKRHALAKARAAVYAACGLSITVSMCILALDHLLGRAPGNHLLFPRNLTFIGETTGLLAFGISWLLASHVFPLLILPQERHKLGMPNPGGDRERRRTRTAAMCRPDAVPRGLARVPTPRHGGATIPDTCASDDDAAFRARLLTTFQAEASQHVKELLATLTALAGTSAEEHSAMLGIAYRAAHSLTGAARCVELADLAQGCAKVEFVLRQLTQSERGTTSAQLQQLFADIDALSAMVQVLSGPKESHDD
jgi:HPt (histidine-containing phosphotransfer) domain-containing protein